MILNRATRFFKRGLFAVQVIGVGVALWKAYQKSQTERKFVTADLDKKFKKGRDIIDEQSWESFPASDAPASNKFT